MNAMKEIFLILPIILPILGALIIWAIRMKYIVRCVFIETLVIINAIVSWLLIIYRPEGKLPLFSFSSSLQMALHLDGLGGFFLGMASTLWIFVSIYAFSYMRDEERQRMFFMFFTLALAATDGIALADNLITLYFFYEMLTIVTIPLVMHGCTPTDMHAGNVYAAYQLGGAAFSFVGIVYVTSVAGGGSFTLGGYVASGGTAMQAVWLVMLLGFGVKACLFPFYRWLPTASVAPTPVTALLHSAAVVKAGIFAILRLSYYCFSPEFLAGTVVGDAGLLLACFTAVFAAVLAVREGHFKRRLAYSTVSNLSYILIGALSFTTAGLEAALCHMLFHALIKMNAFLACGAFMKKSGRSAVADLDGVGYKMPITFACYTVSALSLSGVPLTAGFVSKWKLLSATAETAASGDVFGMIGLAALIVSSLLCAVYMLTCSVRAYFPRSGRENTALVEAREAPVGMWAPMAVFAAVNIVLGIFAQPILDICAGIASGTL